MNTKEIITSYLSEDLKSMFSQIAEDFFDSIEEIRIRINKPIIIIYKSIEFYINKDGKLIKDINDSYKANSMDILKITELISNYSMYAYEEELRNGFLTLPGGHRVGISGKTVLEHNQVKTIKNINGFNIRISHEIIGCADKAIKYIRDPEILHTMIISPPGCGKTTLLRDMIRQISDGIGNSGQTVGIVDERSEIAGCFRGVAQNDVGMRTDVLDGCPKAEGMIILLRSMSPKIIAVDEIGKQNDIFAIEDIINAGVKIICTVHGQSIEDIKLKPVLCQLLQKNIFKRFIILGQGGRIRNIFDQEFKEIR